MNSDIESFHYQLLSITQDAPGIAQWPDGRAVQLAAGAGAGGRWATALPT